MNKPTTFGTACATTKQDFSGLARTLLRLSVAFGMTIGTTVPGYAASVAEQQNNQHIDLVKQRESASMNVPRFNWTKSLPVSSTNTGTGVLGGTEGRCLAEMDKHLYAGIGYWMDAQERNPNLPGAQVLRLDSANSEWKVDLQLDERMTTGKFSGCRRYFAIAAMKSISFHGDGNGKALPKPAAVILAGVWDRLGKLEVFSKTSESEKWVETSLGDQKGRYAEIRSFGSHRDGVTGVERVFAGARINGLPIESQTFSGVYDASAPSGIGWDTKPEVWQGDLSNTVRKTKNSARITSFSECNGKCYATVYNVIYERQDGPKASWKPVWTYVPKKPFENGSSGFIGLTAIANPDGSGQCLLVSLEHNPGIIFRVNPKTWTGTMEINISKSLTEMFGTRAGWVLAGYNDMLSYEPVNRHADKVLLIGFEVATPLAQSTFRPFNPDGHYLIRRPDATYAVGEIVDASQTPRPMLVGVRALIGSPFSDDAPGTIYACGFDANGQEVHNTAWIYKGTPITDGNAHNR